MCGRIALHHSDDVILEHFGVEQAEIDLEPRYNNAPSQPVAVVLREGARALAEHRWGLIPSWAKDPKIGNRMINARSETVAEKPAFRSALRARRCLIPASGFYEWKKEGQQRVPSYIHRADTAPLGLAGLWEEWPSPSGEMLRSCVIITTQANPFMARIHHRMPVILDSDRGAAWLAPDLASPQELLAQLPPYPEGALASHAVSKQVNSPAFDSPACIEPVGDGEPASESETLDLFG